MRKELLAASASAVVAALIITTALRDRQVKDQSSSNSPITENTSQTKNYVYVSGDNLYLDGKKITPYGSTFYPYWNYDGKIIHGDGWTKPEFTQYIDQTIALAKEANLNTLRPTNYFDGIDSTDDSTWWQNPIVWSNMDYLMNQAQKSNIHVLLDLSSFRDRLLKTGKYPYNSNDWKDFINFVGERYRNNSAILNYAIAGEVACPDGKEPLHPESTASLTQFYRSISEQLHSVDPNHLISSGGLSYLNEKNCGIDWQSIYNLPDISMSAIHVYSDNDRNTTVPMVSQWSFSHGKPFTVEEFGFRQGMGDNSRAQAFAQTYSLLSSGKYDAKSLIFWNLGPELASSSYEVNPNTPLTWQIVKSKAP